MEIGNNAHLLYEQHSNSEIFLHLEPPVFSLAMYLVPFSLFSTILILVAPTEITAAFCRPNSLILIT